MGTSRPETAAERALWGEVRPNYADDEHYLALDYVRDLLDALTAAGLRPTREGHVWLDGQEYEVEKLGRSAITYPFTAHLYSVGEGTTDER